MLSRFSRVQLCVTPWTAAHQAPPSLGLSRQEHWSGLPFPSPVRESEVAQSCPTCSDPMNGSPPGSSVHGIFQARVLEWGAIAFSDICTYVCISVVQSLGCIQLFSTPWTAGHQASLSFTISRSLLKLMSIESVMLSSHLLLCHPLLLLSRSSQNTKLNSLWCRASHWLSILHVVVYIYRRRRWHPTPVLLPGKSHGQRSLVGCSPWGH